MRTWIEVDLGALVANARTVAARAAGARLLPMVKADAYGLGAGPVARALEAVSPWGFGVASVEEGRRLREAGIRRPILVLAPLASEFGAAVRYDVRPALGTAAEVRAWLAQAPGRPFHVEVDTGMGRRGIWWEGFGAESAEFREAPGFEGVLTHFHSAATDPASVREQWGRFEAALGTLPARPPLVHAANSAAALRHPETAADLVRPGIFLYGGRAGDDRPAPVVTWKARVLQISWRDAGSTVGYGATYSTRGRACLATLAVGYADGVPRALSNAGAVLLEGRRVPIVGGVMMDMTVVEAGAAVPPPEASATLIGRDGEEMIALDDLAAMAGAISYEILTGLGRRVVRVYR